MASFFRKKIKECEEDSDQYVINWDGNDAKNRKDKKYAPSSGGVNGNSEYFHNDNLEVSDLDEVEDEDGIFSLNSFKSIGIHRDVNKINRRNRRFDYFRKF